MKIILLIILTIVISLFPFNIKISPSHALEITDEDLNPIHKFKAKQIWYQYSLGIRESAEIEFFDGKLYFPERKVKTNIFLLLIGAVKQFATTGIHASYGSSEIITIISDGFQPKTVHDNNGLDTNNVILHRE